LAPFGIGAPVNSLLSIDEALELLLNSAKVTRSTQWLGLDDALNKI
jgi:hypothetical protein